MGLIVVAATFVDHIDYWLNWLGIAIFFLATFACACLPTHSTPSVLCKAQALCLPSAHSRTNPLVSGPTTHAADSYISFRGKQQAAADAAAAKAAAAEEGTANHSTSVIAQSKTSKSAPSNAETTPLVKK